MLTTQLHFKDSFYCSIRYIIQSKVSLYFIQYKYLYFIFKYCFAIISIFSVHSHFCFDWLIAASITHSLSIRNRRSVALSLCRFCSHRQLLRWQRCRQRPAHDRPPFYPSPVTPHHDGTPSPADSPLLIRLPQHVIYSLCFYNFAFHSMFSTRFALLSVFLLLFFFIFFFGSTFLLLYTRFTCWAVFFSLFSLLSLSCHHIRFSVTPCRVFFRRSLVFSRHGTRERSTLFWVTYF